WGGPLIRCATPAARSRFVPGAAAGVPPVNERVPRSDADSKEQPQDGASRRAPMGPAIEAEVMSMDDEHPAQQPARHGGQADAKDNNGSEGEQVLQRRLVLVSIPQCESEQGPQSASRDGERETDLQVHPVKMGVVSPEKHPREN